MKPENLTCPECGAAMVSRETRPTKDLFGSVSRRFWGCSRFPVCKGTRDTEGRSKAERQADRDESEKVWGRR